MKTADRPTPQAPTTTTTNTAETAKSVQRLGALDDSDLYLNRELAWLAFNERVLGEAEDKTNPLLERLKFIIIYHSNLDEFFMVRLSGLLKLVEKDSPLLSSDPYGHDEDAEDTLDEVVIKVRHDFKRASVCLHGSILPALAEKNIVIAKIEDLSRAELERIDDFFEQQVFPVLTPLAVDPAHPFPYLSNLSCYLAAHFQELGDNGEPLLAFVEIPQKLSRLVPISTRARKHKFVLLEDVIRRHLTMLFPWTQVAGASVFRVTRNLDYQLLEGEVKDLMKSIEYELKDRAQKIVVRLEVEQGITEQLRNRLRVALELDPSDVYEVPGGLLNLRDMSLLTKLDGDPTLKDEPFNPRIHPRLADDKDIFDVIRERDIILHHPYDSFVSVLEFLRQAAEDPNVLAIKQTLYRSGGDSPIIETLVKAAEKGKQVTAVVELKARFDEQNNIVWARRLERSGVHVVFGFVGLKTHAKCTLIVRKEGNRLQRYVHLSTGNYNSTTARMYTDIGHFTADPDITGDIVNLFNLLTGFNIVSSEERIGKPSRMPSFEKLEVAPFGLRSHFLQLIDNERKLHTPDNPGHIILKMNSLVDPKLCHGLYKAAQKGVRIDLLVRGVCVLRPGIPGISENIRVVSVIDRFLEHSRIYWFRHGGDPLVFLGSADFMQRNMDRRIEIVWPVQDTGFKAKVTNILHLFLRDNVKSHIMQPDGTYRQNTPGKDKPFRSQEKLIELARQEGVKSIAYDEAIRFIDGITGHRSQTDRRPEAKESHQKHSEGSGGPEKEGDSGHSENGGSASESRVRRKSRKKSSQDSQ